MDGSHMGREKVPIKINGPDRDILIFKIFSFGVKFSFSSLIP
jgi:hypothetical protein